MKKRMLAGILALVMLIGLLPVTALAANGTSLAEQVSNAAAGETITVAAGELIPATIVIDKNLTIQGAGDTKPVLSCGSSFYSMFKIAAGVTVTFKGLAFQDSVRTITSSNTGYEYGGAIFVADDVSGANVTVEDCTFTGFAAWLGGAIQAHSASNLKLNITNCVFTNNKASVGGAVELEACTGTNLAVEGCTFFSNSVAGAVNNGSHGGAIAVNGSMGTERIEIRNCKFIENTANGNGGAVAVLGVNSGRSIKLIGCEFTGNKATRLNEPRTATVSGGAVSLRDTKTVEITNSTFKDNSSSDNGGALHIACGSATATQTTISGTKFLENEASGFGGAIHIASGDATTTINGVLFKQDTANSTLGNEIVYMQSSYATTNSYIRATDGAAFCPDATKDVIFVNSDKVAQDDTVSITDYMLDGTRLNWKVEDEDGALTAAEPEAYRTITGDMWLDGAQLFLDSDTNAPMSTDPEDYSNSFVGNSAEYGGAISNYGSLHIGMPGKDITVNKVWKDAAPSNIDKVEVQLVRVADEAVLDTAEAAADTWSATFCGFPANVTYSLKETEISGYTSEWEKTSETDAADVWTLTNTAGDNPGLPPLIPVLGNKATPKLNTRDHFAYVQGYPDGTVKPAGSITRAEVAAILFRLMDADSRSLYYSTASGFRDVDSSKWYNTYVATLNNAGVITDSRTGYFRPNDAITRAELAAMLAQFAEKKSAAIYFSDVSAGYWAANAIALTANLGWINGYPDGTFGPDKTVTRAELMAMVNRATGRAPESTEALLPNMKTWKDNADTSLWYYLDVQEATNSHTYTGAPTETWTSLTASPDWSQYE